MVSCHIFLPLNRKFVRWNKDGWNYGFRTPLTVAFGRLRLVGEHHVTLIPAHDWTRGMYNYVMENQERAVSARKPGSEDRSIATQRLKLELQ